MQTFGQRVAAARRAKGLTLQQVARAILSHKGYVSGFEHAKVNPPSPKILRRLCRRLDLPLEEMLALAWWTKRPKGLSAAVMLGVLKDANEAELLAKVKKDLPTAALG